MPDIRDKGGIIPVTLKIVLSPFWGPFALIDYLWCNYRWFQWPQPYRSWHCYLFGHHMTVGRPGAWIWRGDTLKCTYCDHTTVVE